METKTESEVTVENTVNANEEVTKASEDTAVAEVKRVSTKEIIAYLAEKFPACFSTQGAAKPLKIGIFQELAEKLVDDETVSKTRLRQALRHYTSSWRYLKVVKLGAFRVNIDGEEVAEIDQEQADYAAKTLKESQEKFGNKNIKDNAIKKPYKGKKPENKASKPTTQGKDRTKFKSVKSTAKSGERTKPKAAVKLTPVASDAVIVGKQVKVQLGNAPLDAVITEVSGSDISVQLNSGMVVKTQIKNIFTE